ncbi:secretory carrier membrane protein [Tritrichomonas foetus]|uniref:Secretory carrier membrane protein n=1 Tax=Tritrichomonas foetus TaxID=1144522 RepID=A0A1J4L2H7_9EUKA|nr:secretory carrier membrane protein [Tritrichomonas foetus]|eukprot:OHT16093.1 secretory carrier membrane protein [Tritrichomonas foetus]
MSETTAERFARLQAKEQELRDREKALKKQDVFIEEDKSNNFPPFFPLVHHDIVNDIPLSSQWTIKIAFLAQFFWAAQLLINFVAACTTGTIHLGSGKYSLGTNIVFSIIIMILGVPCAFKLNYMKLYSQAKKNAIKGTFFILQGLFIAVNVYGFVGLKNNGVMGVITTIDALAASTSGFCKAMVIIATVMWASSSLIQLFLFGRVMLIYKNGGAPPAPSVDTSATTANYGAEI